jgi:hypothetical protein
MGSIVRVFDVDALREATLVLAPAGWSGTTPGMVAVDSALGAALVGGRVGETRRWGGPSESNRLQIVSIAGRMPAKGWAPSKTFPHTPRTGLFTEEDSGTRSFRRSSPGSPLET